MRPLPSPHQTSAGHQAFTAAVDDWLRRPRPPHAAETVLDAVQRRQERQEEAPHAAPTSADTGTPAPPSPTLVRAAQLLKLQGEQPWETWCVPPGRPVLVGRSGKTPASVDVDLWPDTSVSRRQALLWCDGEGWWIEDLRSTNGTVLGARNIRGQRALRLAPGTTIQCGRTVLRLTTLAPASGERAQASAEAPSAG